MLVGRFRSVAPYRWPSTLRLSERPPLLVYLDLNQWICLSKTRSGHKDGAKFRGVLDACLTARVDGRALFPISDAIYFEVSKIASHRQRRDLRIVIEELSGFHVVTGRSVISTHEVEAMLDELVGPSADPINTVSYLDWGVARAFGMVGGFRVRDRSGQDVTASAREGHRDGPEAFDALLAQAELDLQRQVLEGPASAEEEQELRNLGWDPYSADRVARSRAQQEQDQVLVFDADPRWRRERIRDVISAREIFIEINETLSRGLAARGASGLDTLDVDLPTNRAAFDAMPSFDAAVTIKAAYHRDGQHKWTANDIVDIDALGSTLPYCDIVVTDKAVATQVRQAGLDQRLGTTVLSRLMELPDLIAT